MNFSEFVFNLPLYTEIELPEDMRLKANIVGFLGAKIDGHCVQCGKVSTFTLKTNYGGIYYHNSGERQMVKERTFDSFTLLSCARNPLHAIKVWCVTKQNKAIKFGQTPSLADIANDEASHYRDVLDKEDSSELHKAIGLAAHGVGVGSFVYLRRIFERLVQSRFEDFREVEEWNEDDFRKLRMDEKVTFLKGHLPEFIVENRKLYSILSIGIHELTEEKCLAAFDPIRMSIKIILEEDKKKKEELDLKRQASEAIAKFSS